MSPLLTLTDALRVAVAMPHHALLPGDVLLPLGAGRVVVVREITEEQYLEILSAPTAEDEPQEGQG